MLPVVCRFLPSLSFSSVLSPIYLTTLFFVFFYTPTSSLLSPLYLACYLELSLPSPSFDSPVQVFSPSHLFLSLSLSFLEFTPLVFCRHPLSFQRVLPVFVFLHHFSSRVSICFELSPSSSIPPFFRLLSRVDAMVFIPPLPPLTPLCVSLPFPTSMAGGVIQNFHSSRLTKTQLSSREAVGYI